VSQRPRLAGDGQLRLPDSVTHGPEDFLLGRLSARTVDPFDWTAERLLLTESFARLDLSDRDIVRDWCATHGVVDAWDYLGPRAWIPDRSWMSGHGDRFADHARDIAAEQANVAWHLATLARLSDRRRTRDWDPALGQLVLDGGDNGQLVVGGPDAGVAPGIRPRELDDRELTEDEHLAIAETARRVRRATADWPVVRVSDEAWSATWDATGESLGGDLPDTPEGKARAVGATWDGTVQLERLLLGPYVTRAVERRFTLVVEPQDVDGETRRVLVPREERGWRSILAPIHLQLLEALRRITEGEPGAAICRECGRPFLVLDARRRFFCNDRERFRNAQRGRRRRLAQERGEA
jgi:hypothetical protein